jgi:hypothetical protein
MRENGRLKVHLRHKLFNIHEMKQNFPIVSHQWCDLFYRLLHSYTRHIERVVRGERDTLLSAQK